MIEILDSKKCCGCTACMSICPKQAISMKPDVLGFLYPKVNLEICVDCGLCERICSFSDCYDTSLNFPNPLAYGARHLDMREVETSRSGAAFIALSDWILDQGGVVYGAGFVDHFRVAHKRASTKAERDEFKGSKYVQSDLGETFKQVRDDLKNGLVVMYSGTACQIAGLKSFIGQKLSTQLYLVDIVCHGSPAPYIWRDYLAWIEKKYGDVARMSFRDKSLGWANHVESFTLRNGSIIRTNLYRDLFLKNIMLRDCCGNCHFANTKRPSDVTIADFWGWKKTNATVNLDDKGLSLLFINTDKGKRIFEKASDSLNYFPAKLEDCLQPNLKQPSVINPKRKQFELDFQKKGFEYIIGRYTDLFWWNRLKKKLSIYKKCCKTFVKNLLGKTK